METTVRTAPGKYKVGDVYALQGVDYIITNIEESSVMDRLHLSEDGADSTVDAVEAEKEFLARNIVVEYNGMLFSADDESQSRMHRAISVMEKNNIESEYWKLKEPMEDGTLYYPVTVDDLYSIMALGLLEIKKIIVG